MSDKRAKPNEVGRRQFLGGLTGGLIGLAAGSMAPLGGCGGGHTNNMPAAGCAPQGSLPAALTTCRSWITFSPPRPFDPNTNIYPTQVELQGALTRLYNEGWRGLVTYSLDGTLSAVPQIAKQIGFTMVIAGLFWFDAAQLARERTAALAQVAYIDGFVLGNEGLSSGRYTRQQLEEQIASLRADTGRPITTSEPLNQYSDPTLLSVGDWAFPNIHPWNQGIRSVSEAVGFVQSQYHTLQSVAPGRSIIIKESWWPTGGGDPAATEANQSAFFRQLAATDVKVVFGEAYDQFWKTTEAALGPYWGWHTDMGEAKRVVADLHATYTAPYGP